MKPSSVNSQNSPQVWINLYEKKNLNKQSLPKLKIGDKVRISIEKTPFQKRYDQIWTEEIFIITCIIASNPAVRSRFNAANPIRGVFFANMLQPSGTPIPISVATRPLVEGDILVRVGDGDALQKARTDDEILAALDAVIPFIEVPDLIYSAESSIDARAIAVANAGARTGWVGYPIPMTLKDWQTLSQVSVHLTLKTGSTTTTRTTPLGQGLGMEPAAVVRWLRDGLRDGLRDNLRRSRGQSPLPLKRGDILSLGTLLPPVPAHPGMEISLRYLGLGPGQGAIVYGRFQ